MSRRLPGSISAVAARRSFAAPRFLFPKIALSAAAVWLLTANNSSAQWFEQFKLTASDAAADDNFGGGPFDEHAAIDGNIAIVGAARNDDAGSNSGSAYLFDVTTGDELFKLTASDAAASDFFGVSVDISGNTAIVGAWVNDDAGTSSGSAYLFDVTSGQELFKLTASDAAVQDLFGNSVAIDGQIAIVGAHAKDDDDDGMNSGSAYLFDAATGQQLFKLTASDAAAFDLFGGSVAISGNVAIVGAAHNDDAGTASGSAYLFDVTTGDELFKLTASDAAASAHFGISVAIDGNIAIVGATPGPEIPFGPSGVAYVFDVTTGEEIVKLVPSDPLGQVNLFLSIEISGDIAIIGNKGTNDAGSSSGSAFMFDVHTGQELSKLTASDADAGDFFGGSVAISGDKVIVTAFGEDEAALEAGAAYIFQLAEWIAPGSGNWNLVGNWNGALPNSSNAWVLFGEAIVAPATVTVDTDVTISRMIFNNAAHDYTLGDDATHTLTLAANSAINVAAGSHTIAAPLVGSGSLRKTGNGTLTLAGNNTYTGETLVDEGTLAVSSANALGGTSQVIVAAGATLDTSPLTNFQTHANQTLRGSGSITADQLTLVPTSTLRGTLTVEGTLANGGRVAPGNSPGIIEIDGDYTQTATGILEIEVAGVTTPGTDYDQLQVTGTATLGGRLELALLDPFVPAIDDKITFLTAGSVVNTFDALYAPTLAAANPNLAVDLIYNATDLRAHFVEPSTDIEFDDQTGTADWADTGTWTTATVPGSTNIIAVDNLTGTAQRVDVQTDDAFVHRLTVSGGVAPITVGIQSGYNLSATSGVTVGDQATVELDDGTLLGSTIAIEGGGELSGSGTVVGELVVGIDSAQGATLSPGIDSVGEVNIEGTYQQGANGVLVAELDGTGAGQFDTVNVSGDVQLGGMLVIDASELGSVTPGTTFDILTAESVSGEFGDVLTVGGGDIIFAPFYTEEGAGATGYHLGDMNRNFSPPWESPEESAADTAAFALALTNGEAYKGAYGVSAEYWGNIDGIGGQDFDDIDDFAELLYPGGGAGAMARIFAAIDAQLNHSVPEPSSILLLLCGGYFLASFGRRSHR